MHELDLHGKQVTQCYICIYRIRRALYVHSEVTPLIPKSSAIITAAFSPIAIAVLYVLAPTLSGEILQSEEKYQIYINLFKKKQ